MTLILVLAAVAALLVVIAFHWNSFIGGFYE
jgi:hypothetical protein